MQIVFVHQNFPAQFGHVARYLTDQFGDECIFVSRQPEGIAGGVRRIQYRLKGGATQQTHYCSRTFENAVWHAHAVHDALAGADVRPDLIVGHSGFGSTIFLHELYDCPIVNYFEFFYEPHGTDMDYRPEFAPKPIDFLRARTRNGMILLDLHYCTAGYSPTRWQQSRLPAEYRSKVEVLFDGIDTQLWSPNPAAERRIGDWTVPAGCKLVTYAARGLEAMRGFDIFMEVTHRLGKRRSDVVFVVAGQDKVCYGNDLHHTGGKPLREHLFATKGYDPSRFQFFPWLSPQDLARMFQLSDAHIYLTVPFVLSWSLFNALGSGCFVVGSDTPPVRELIDSGRNGQLVDFNDIDGFVDAIDKGLTEPASVRSLRDAARQTILAEYAFERCLPRIADFFHTTATR